MLTVPVYNGDIVSSDWSISGGALGARGKSKIGNLFGTKKKNFMSRKRKEDGNKSMKSMKSMKSVRRQQSRKDVGKVFFCVRRQTSAFCIQSQWRLDSDSM